MRNCLSRRKTMVSSMVGISLLAALSITSIPASAQEGVAAAPGAARANAAANKPTPMTPDGHPDLNGFWNNPAGGNGTEKFERAADGSILFDFSRAFKIAVGKRCKRSFRI